jgi:CRISP-associated protein Cas1
MKKLLNTLYVTTQGSYLAKDGETVLVRVEHENRLRVPLHTLSGIVCFGQVSCSPPLMGFCAEKDVALSFLTEHGKFLARVQGPVNGNVLLRREQYRRAGRSSQFCYDRAGGSAGQDRQLPHCAPAGDAGTRSEQ